MFLDALVSALMPSCLQMHTGRV